MVKILCFGGGNVLPNLILKPLSKVNGIQLTAVSSMTDNGGSAGALRKELNILPPGDIRRHILGLSQAEDWKKKLFKLRFSNIEFPGGHKGHNFANVFIGGIEKVTGDFSKTLDILHDFMKVNGRCLPATIDKTNIVVELENGEKIVGEDEIDVPKKHDSNKKIVKAWLEPEAKAYPETLEAINNTDFIIISAGDLYTSLVPCFIPKGIKEALSNTKAKKILIIPSMTKMGETNGMTVKEYTDVIEKYTTEVDHVIYNTGIPSKERTENYKKEHPELLEIMKFDNLDKKFIGLDLLVKEGPIEYDSKKITKKILELVGV